MKLFAVGINHATAPVELREKVAIPTESLSENLSRLMGLADLSEGMLLSTCNRVEVYGVPGGHMDPHRIIAGLASMRGIALDNLAPHCFTRDEALAARHIFRVAASLESMVVGEPQILGQVKDTYRVAEQAGTVGAVLNRCMTSAFRGAKRVRTETRVGEGGASIPAVAVDLARSIFGELRGCRALLLGAGEMGAQAGVHLRAADVRELVVVNRSTDRGRALASELGGRYVEWAQLEAELCEMDIVVASTGSPTPVIDLPLVKRVARSRRGRPVFFVDIAVPRDVASEVADIENCFVYNIDHLQKIVQENMNQRLAYCESASSLVDEEVQAFLSWQRTRSVAPVIGKLQTRSDAIAAAEVERALARLPELDEQQQNIVRAMGRSIAQKLLHPAKTALRNEAVGTDGNVDKMAEITEILFDLRDGKDG